MALFLVTPAMRPVMAWFQGAFFWLCRLWLALGASDFALARQPSRYLFLVPFAQLIVGLAMKFGHRAFLVPAPAFNSWILIALARAAAAFAVSASRCRRCYRVFCAPCTPAFEPVLVLYIYIFWR